MDDVCTRKARQSRKGLRLIRSEGKKKENYLSFDWPSNVRIQQQTIKRNSVGNKHTQKNNSLLDEVN